MKQSDWRLEIHPAIGRSWDVQHRVQRCKGPYDISRAYFEQRAKSVSRKWIAQQDDRTDDSLECDDSIRALAIINRRHGLVENREIGALETVQRLVRTLLQYQIQALPRINFRNVA